MQTKFIAGEKTKEVLYKENNCFFRFNLDTTYFSPRLSNERKDIAEQIKKNEKILTIYSESESRLREAVKFYAKNEAVSIA